MTWLSLSEKSARTWRLDRPAASDIAESSLFLPLDWPGEHACRQDRRRVKFEEPLRMLLEAWRRRWWRPDAAALAAYADLRPMVVVTGGSEGIGYQLAHRFAAAGNDVMLVARRAEPLEQAAAAIRAELKVEAVTVPADVTEPDAAATIDRALAAQRAYADVLINSAGIGLAGPFHAQAPEDLTRLMDLNMRALTVLT